MWSIDETNEADGIDLAIEKDGQCVVFCNV